MVFPKLLDFMDSQYFKQQILFGYLVAQMVKRLSAMQETRGLIPGLGRSPGEGDGSPLQYSCLKNPMDGGATVHGVTKSCT